jgi:hypothetical protein
MPFDPKQISALEKAVEEKYGETAVLDPSTLWTPDKEKAYLDQVKAVEKYYRQQPYENQVDQGGFILREKLLNKKSFKNCSYCGDQVYKAMDEMYMTKFSCCFNCYVLHLEGRENKWQK